MSDSPTLEQKKSRRGLLALVGAGGAAAVAALLGRSDEAEALGPTYHESSTTTPAVHGNNIANGYGVMGSGNNSVAVYGESSNYIGVYGLSNSDTFHGVMGLCGSGNGVFGSSALGVGVRGFATDGTGVKGEGKPGVYGICNKDNGSGVRGDGNAPGSIGGLFNNTPSRRALRTKGKVQMDCVRKKSLSNLKNTIALPTGVRAGSTAAVLATINGDPGNDAVVSRAFRIDSTHIRIVFNKKPANPVSVAYWVVHPA